MVLGFNCLADAIITRENIYILTFTDLFSPKRSVAWFRAQIAQFVDIPDCLWHTEQVKQENMEDLSVEVCGKNGAYYKVRTTKLKYNSGDI